MKQLNQVQVNYLKFLQQGGAVNTAENKKEKLFPYFAYIYSKQLDPEKYGAATTQEEWSSLINESPEDVEKITAAATELSEEDWGVIEEEYNKLQQDQEVQNLNCC